MVELDRKILKELEKNSRATNIQLARKLKVSEGTVRQRIQKLVKKGVIKRFTIDIAPVTGFSAFVLIKTDPQVRTGLIVNKIKKIEDVKRIYEVAGDFDVIVEIFTASAERFNNKIEKIRTLNGVLKTESLVVLKVS